MKMVHSEKSTSEVTFDSVKFVNNVKELRNKFEHHRYGFIKHGYHFGQGAIVSGHVLIS